MKILCPHCGMILGHPRGAERVRLTKLPVLVLRFAASGFSIESMCPECRRDISIPIAEAEVDPSRAVDFCP